MGREISSGIVEDRISFSNKQQQQQIEWLTENEVLTRGLPYEIFVAHFLDAGLISASFDVRWTLTVVDVVTVVDAVHEAQMFAFTLCTNNGTLRRLVLPSSLAR